jgi:thiopurine S-methyltransferase
LRTEDWHDRWANGRTGWHEPDGNAGLKKHWCWKSGSVLVPFCGKSPDLAWLARRGHDVVGVELSEIAVRHFFAEQGLEFDTDQEGSLTRFSAIQLPISIYCGDYFSFELSSFDALYDRGALVAVDPLIRQKYAAHTRRLLKSAARQLIVTLEYDQEVVQGPPFAVTADEMSALWNDLERVAEQDDIDNCPPKFLDAGLTDIKEVVWRSVR